MIIPSFCELPHLQYLPTAKCTTSSKHSPVFFFCNVLLCGIWQNKTGVLLFTTVTQILI